MSAHQHIHHSASASPHEHDFRGAGKKSLLIVLALVSAYMLVEVIGGLAANSLSLLADAGHMATDALALGLAVFAIWLAMRQPSARLTYGFHRSEMLAAGLNTLSLWILAVWIFIEAYRRFLSPPEVQGVLTLSIGAVGLVVNIASALILRRSAGESLNIEGAFLHVLGNLLGSIGVVGAGLLIIAFGWFIADPIFGVIIGLLIIVSSGRLFWKVLRVLMEGTPARLCVQLLCQRLESVEGVTGVHDIHVWSLTSGYEVLSAHVTADMTEAGARERLLQQLRRIPSEEFGISHATMQLEDSPDGCEELHHIQHPGPDLPRSQ
jgi:cobalt-zinc-cadmium efflux system protein